MNDLLEILIFLDLPSDLASDANLIQKQ